ncbi:hypothetical protein OROGR_009580 [Orobanche gracilis]
MSGYSRIKNLHPNESSSSDCFLSSSQKKHKNNQQSQEFETREPHSEMKNGDTYKDSRSGSGGAKFRRNTSVSSSSSSSSSPSSAVKRAFPIRRSSSVSDRYCRIRDQRVALSFPLDDEEFDQSFNKGKKSGHKGIFKSCKRIFGL